MPYRKEQFINDGIYHIILRGLDDNLIFKNINDYYRGIFSIYEFNNANRIEIRKRREERKREKTSGVPDSAIDKRKKLAEVLLFCFMPNHIHLLLKQLSDGGIVKFMNKLGSGYAGYFNRKYKRKGYVFQNRFRSVPIQDDRQFQTIFRYIHANPVSLIEPDWKENGIKNIKEANKFLAEYKWSSFQDYVGVKNFPSVTDRDFVLESMNGAVGCKEAVEDWVDYKRRLNQHQEILLD